MAEDDLIAVELSRLLAESTDAAQRRAACAFDERAAPLSPSRLVLFGAGHLGRRLLHRLPGLGYEVLALCDNDSRGWGRTLEGVPLTSPAEAARTHGAHAVFLVTAFSGAHPVAAMIAQLASLGVQRALPLALLYWKHPAAFLPYFHLDLPHQLLEVRREVRDAYRLLADPLSRRTFVQQVAYRLHHDPKVLAEPERPTTYWPAALFKPPPLSWTG